MTKGPCTKIQSSVYLSISIQALSTQVWQGRGTVLDWCLLSSTGRNFWLCSNFCIVQVCKFSQFYLLILIMFKKYHFIAIVLLFCGYRATSNQSLRYFQSETHLDDDLSMNIQNKEHLQTVMQHLHKNGSVDHAFMQSCCLKF